jgi:hypothetical protein
MIRKNLLLKAGASFIVIFFVVLFITKIGGPLGNYPPIGRHSIPWSDVFDDITYILQVSFGITVIAYLGLYWDWYSKNKGKKK